MLISFVNYALITLHILDHPVAFADADVAIIWNLYNHFIPMIMVQEFVALLIPSGDGRIA